MTFFLKAQNVFDYLVERGLCKREEQSLLKIESKSSRNFNLLVSFAEQRHLLVKQEPDDMEGETLGLFLKEWRIQQLVKKYSELSHLSSRITEVIDYDSSNSIIIFNYLKDYGDLLDFYLEKKVFPTAIAAAIGSILAAVHRSTIDKRQYEEFFVGNELNIDKNPNFLDGLEPIEPEIFGIISRDNLKFFELFQRYDRLKDAIAQLNATFESCCLTHNDLKLDNILLCQQWDQAKSNIDLSALGLVRLIDWENCTWGDPAFDLGMAIACYLKIWLNSMVVGMEMETALRLAIVPLERVQPSIVALTKAYLQNFPEIWERRPNFLLGVLQFTGYSLIKKMRIRLECQQPFGYPEPFGYAGICKLQVAKTLLCEPARSLRNSSIVTSVRLPRKPISLSDANTHIHQVACTRNRFGGRTT
jgi:5-methylthioribose kinase